MIDLELRRKVAEAAGWTAIRFNLDRPATSIARLVGLRPKEQHPYRYNRAGVPAYETDIAAAISLVHEMRKAPDVAEVIVNWGRDDDGDWSSCEVIRWKQYEKIEQQDAETAHRSICLAYLAWKEAQS
jgi:hypothetical protein